MEQFVACRNCGATNRIVGGKAGAVCGACKTPLPATGKAEAVTDSSWESFIATKRLPVLVDFWAPWCGPCRMVGPIVEQMAQKHFGRLRVGKLNTDENPMVSSRFGFEAFPRSCCFMTARWSTSWRGRSRLRNSMLGSSATCLRSNPAPNCGHCGAPEWRGPAVGMRILLVHTAARRNAYDDCETLGFGRAAEPCPPNDAEHA